MSDAIEDGDGKRPPETRVKREPSFSLLLTNLDWLEPTYESLTYRMGKNDVGTYFCVITDKGPHTEPEKDREYKGVEDTLKGAIQSALREANQCQK